MTPCLVIPFVFGYIPKTQFIYLEETENIIFQSQNLEKDSVVTNLIWIINNSIFYFIILHYIILYYIILYYIILYYIILYYIILCICFNFRTNISLWEFIQVKIALILLSCNLNPSLLWSNLSINFVPHTESLIPIKLSKRILKMSITCKMDLHILINILKISIFHKE